MKRLPIGTQSFENLRKNDCVYVDKTEVIHRIISEGRIYFLSRPRRFGKSLLISTLEMIFRGREELFEGLYIYDKWDWSQQFPVVKIDWTLIDHSTPEKIENSLVFHMKEVARSYQIALGAESAINCFGELIESLHNKTGKQVVVLIDEYDKPITSHLFDSYLKPVRTAVHDFYQVMKGADEHLRFVFLTGVSKFSGLSIFSALNNLDDITLHEQYAAVCGYTQEELESNFSEHIDVVTTHLNMTREYLLDRIRYWYNGYTWDGKTAIYNPFSTLKFFKVREFAGYWFGTGTPAFLIDMIQRRNRADAVLEPIVTGEKVFDGYDPADIGDVPLLFQTGYLTIKRKELINGRPRYTLGVPNSEVNEALLTCLLHAYGKYPGEQIDKLRMTMERQLTVGDEAGFARSLEMMIATVPYELHIPREAYYHSLMLIWMRLLGFNIQGEVLNNRGRADAVWEQPGGVTVVAEIKYHAEKTTKALLDEAMTQIRDRRYYNKYTGKVILLGVAFSGKNIGCRMEE
ncbi:MAG: ATP-binding protein [Tannerella sp.]|jgi:hypothetical protein|nr:ATP-binding protein [Tannerella sp.]